MPKLQNAWIAPELAMCLNSVPDVDAIPLGHMNAGISNIPKARLDDIIAYRWHGGGMNTGLGLPLWAKQ